MLLSIGSLRSLHFSYMKYNSRLLVHVLAVVLVLLSSFATPASSCTEQEKTSLLQFLAGLSQDSGLAKSWQGHVTDCCKWEGVTCNGNKTVIEVSLPSRGLEGRITPSLGSLTGLQHLNLSYNSLSGGLPLELVLSSSIVNLDVSFNQLSGDLHDLQSSTHRPQPLQVLNISSNMFTGQFTSTTWKGMRNLIALNASNNSFIGQIPTHFCKISTSFAVLELSNNRLSGSIPSGLGNCSMLRLLKASRNKLRGTLPDELFNTTMLEHLSFSSNSLHGILDGTHIAKLTNLVILDLGQNNFNDKIPHSIGQLRRLQELHLDYNNMYGELPSTLSNCTDLIRINLRNNSFTGELAKVNFSNLENLETLDLSWNNFSGTIPESIYSCIKLTALRLSNNNFQRQQLSKGIGNLKSLSFLSLANDGLTNITGALHILRGSKNLNTILIGQNFMNETMPDDDIIDGFENLRYLSIGSCQLSGTIPLWISKLSVLEILVLNKNQLSGPIPTWIYTLNYLFHLDISNNKFTGEIPKELINMQMLTSNKTIGNWHPTIFGLTVCSGPTGQYRTSDSFPKALYLSGNELTGVIPPEIGQLKALQVLDVSSNNLKGSIPSSICNLTNLQLLDLSNNDLTGEIPVALDNLSFLAAFNISNNNLEGPIPTGGQFSTFLNSSFAGNPRLCGPVINKSCGSAEAGPALSIVYTDESWGSKVAAAVSFVVFFGVGVLYDQMVLSRYFG